MLSLFPHASRIGFGCASLGSRVDAKRGLAALASAFDCGVRWFDLAPSYGDGQAEEIFSIFAEGRRSAICICTKCGIVAPRTRQVAAALRPLAQKVVAYAPGLRKFVASGRPAAAQQSLSSSFIRQSVQRSLQRLRTDYVDILALHDPDPEDLERDDIRSALEQVVTSGYARAVGIAGSLEAAVNGLRRGLPISHVQFANNPLQPQIGELAQSGANAKSIYVSTYSAFGPPMLVQRLLQTVRSQPKLEALLRRTGYELPIEDAIRAALVDYALQTNPTGTVLFSMLSPHHLQFNIARANMAHRPDPAPLFEALLGSSISRS
jgi:aryl-alcohol dehydrogenase-like predicted oxidoreductase